MNKKFLSAILFGALMVSSTGTFVSCKDYDDDIDELTSRVDGVEGQIKDLEAKINAANWITSVTPATGGFTVDETIKAPNRIALKNFLFIIEKL